MSKPRRTKEVSIGWDNIRSMISCILENGDESQFECMERNRAIIESGDPNAEPSTSQDTCPCGGCVATRAAWKAIAWIDARL